MLDQHAQTQDSLLVDGRDSGELDGRPRRAGLAFDTAWLFADPGDASSGGDSVARGDRDRYVEVVTDGERHVGLEQQSTRAGVQGRACGALAAELAGGQVEASQMQTKVDIDTSLRAALHEFGRLRRCDGEDAATAFAHVPYETRSRQQGAAGAAGRQSNVAAGLDPFEAAIGRR
jgi:hypothetical protein